MRLPVEKIHRLGLPIGYKFNSYLTVVKEICRQERVYYFCLFSYWKFSEKLRIIIQLSPHCVHVMTYQLMTTLGTTDTLSIKKSLGIVKPTAQFYLFKEATLKVSALQISIC